MTLAPDSRAWDVTYEKKDDTWYANFMFVDLEFDGFMVSMHLDYDRQVEIRFHSKGSEYILLHEALMELFYECVTLAKVELLELEDDDE